jgi:tetratricopeptide (TPR) repeat protein
MLNARRPRDARAVLESGLALDPSDPDLQLALGQSLELTDDLDGATQCYRQVADGHPGHRSRALTRLSGALRKQHRPASALMAARVAAWNDASDDAAWRAVGQALKESGWLHEAVAAFRRSHDLLRRPGGRGGDLPTFSRTSRAKLRHDVQQIEYLVSQGLADKTLHSMEKNLRLVMEGMPDTLPDGQSVTLPSPVRRRLRGIYNRCHRYRETPQLARAAVNPELAAEEISAEYRSRPPGLTWIDGLLTDEALESLRRFCLESTIWYDFEHRNGYVGAYLQDGFNCPLLLQIADELPRSLPDIFGDHVLMQLWAYKYDSRLAGIDMHADFAAINVNFWITPDAANRNPETGGIVIWDREAPADWGVDEYNTYDPAQQQRILEYLEQEGATRIVVPYRENRCVIFDSDLFHKTDDIDFGDRYEDRRINVTMLYGTRGGSRGRRRGGA